MLVQREMESGRFLLASIAVFDIRVCTTLLNVAAGGRGTLLKLQLVSKRNQVGWCPRIHAPLTPQNETG